MSLDRKVIISLVVLSFAWFGALQLLCQNVSVGLSFPKDEVGKIGCVVDMGNSQLVLSKQEIKDGVSVSFPISINAQHFFFTFQRRDKPYRIKAICLFGWPVFRASWVFSNIAPRGDVYAVATVIEGALLVDSRKENGELDYVRFFDLMLKGARLVYFGLALLPFCLLFTVMLFVWCWRNVECVDRPSVFVFLLTIFTVLSFPNPVWSSCPGLDSSWTWFLNHVSWSHFFGTDVVFTYGPLGFLLHPEGTLQNAIAGLILTLSFSAIWFLLLKVLYFNVQNGRSAAWLLLLSMLFPQMNLEWRLVVLTILLVVVANLLANDQQQGNHLENLMLAFGGIFLAVNSLIKFSALAVVLGTQMFCMIWLFFRLRKRALIPILFFLTSFLVAFLVLCGCCFSSIESFVLWLRGSIATANGYNIYMVAEKGWIELCFPFVLLAIGFALCLLRGGWRMLGVMLLASPYLFCTVKYAIVRQSSLPLMYGIVAMLAVSTVKICKIKRCAFCLTIGFYCLSIMMIAPYFMSGLYSGFPFGLNPVGIVKTLFLSHHCETVKRETAISLATKDIPSEWRKRMGQNRVLFVPFEMAPAMQTNTYFSITALPSLQLYSACHPYLDKLNAELLNGGSAPDWIVCGIEPFWSGHFLNYPRFWSDVLVHYRVEAESEFYLLLKRCKGGIGTGAISSQESEFLIEVGKWFDCHKLPSHDIRIEWERSCFGKFCGTFLRATMCYITIRYDDGTESKFQLVSDNTKAYPYSLDCIPCDKDDFIRVLKRMPMVHKPIALKFDAVTLSHLLPTVKVFSCTRSPSLNHISDRVGAYRFQGGVEAAVRRHDGFSSPLEDMAPLLSREELKKWSITD